MQSNSLSPQGGTADENNELYIGHSFLIDILLLYHVVKLKFIYWYKETVDCSNHSDIFQHASRLLENTKIIQTLKMQQQLCILQNKFEKCSCLGLTTFMFKICDLLLKDPNEWKWMSFLHIVQQTLLP